MRSLLLLGSLLLGQTNSSAGEEYSRADLIKLLSLPTDRSWRLPRQLRVRYNLQPIAIKRARRVCGFGGGGIKCRKRLERPNQDTDMKIKITGPFKSKGLGLTVKAEF